MSGKNLLPSDGDVQYYSDFLSSSESEKIFAQLLDDVRWGQESIIVFGKKVNQPRRIAWYGDSGISYSYSGLDLKTLEWSPTLLKLKLQVETFHSEASEN